MQREVRPQARQYFVRDQRFHFERYAGHRHQYFPAALEPHSRGRTVAVRQYRTAVRHERLSPVQFVECDSAYGQLPPDRFIHLFIADQPHTEQLRERMFGDVVPGRAESPGDQHDAYPCERFVHGPRDLVRIVLYRGDLRYFDSVFAERAAQPCRIGVDDLSDQQFVADGDNFCLHSSFE